MALQYTHLDPEARDLMQTEIEVDVRDVRVRASSWLTQTGRDAWTGLLLSAAREHDDAWLAERLDTLDLVAHEQHVVHLGVRRLRKRPPHLIEDIAEDAFNYYYCRAVCLLADRRAESNVQVYRGRSPRKRRRQAEVMIGRKLNAAMLLMELRTGGDTEGALGMRGGPNSGLSVRLPGVQHSD